MNRLPNMMMLDFCEFVKKKSRRARNDSKDTFALLFDDIHRDKLLHLAEDFLEKNAYSLKGLLHRYIDSEYFERSMHHFPPEMFKKAIRYRYYGIEELKHMARDCRCCSCCERSFFDFLDNLEDIGEFPQYSIDPHDLISNLQYALRDESEQVVMSFMTSLGIDFDCEIDFLEWLINTQNEPLSIAKMPMSVFEDLVESYLTDSGKGDSARRQLVKSFKQTDNWIFGSLLNKLLPYYSDKRPKSIKQVLERYYEQNIPYKCVFLPLSAETEEYKKLIRDYWRDLHTISSDYLDIFYSETDYGKSGAEIQSKIISLPSTLTNKYPCIIIWGDEIKEAMSVNIGGLANREIVDVIVSIVNAIKASKTLESIVESANCTAKGLLEKDRPINSTVNVYGDKNSVFGVVSGGKINIENT